ncbi:MAG: porin family protein [Flavobacteriales bacterium]
MKKVNFLILLFTFSAFSQFEYGLKAGINFNGNLNVALDIESLGLGFPTNNYESRSGEHFGLFFKINFKKIYLRPEINYTRIKNSYDLFLVPKRDVFTDFNETQIDVPVLIGYKPFKYLNIFAGPRFKFNKKVKNLNNVIISDLNTDFQIGLQYGVGVKFYKFELDLRVERGFEKNEINYLKDAIGSKNQFITSIGKVYLLALSFYL